MSEEINGVEYINARSRFLAEKRLEPSVDLVVSKIVGKKIYSQDPRLIKLIVKWKKGKSEDSNEPDNFLHNPVFIRELQEVLKKDF